MRKVIFGFLLFPIWAFSAQAGPPSYPAIIEEGFFIPDTKWVNYRLGYIAYKASDLVMKFDNSAKEQNFHLRKVKVDGNFGTFVLNIKERLDLYTQIGSYKLEPEFRQLSNLYIMKSATDILYRGGARLVFFEILNFTLGADIQYSIFSAASSFLTLNDRPIQNDSKISLKEWQIAVGLAQKITILRPYIGVAYRDTQIRLKKLPFLPSRLNLSFQKQAGVYLGVAASLGSFVSVIGEVRLVNERSSALSLDVRF